MSAFLSKDRFRSNRYADKKPWLKRGIFCVLLQLSQYCAGAINGVTTTGERELQCESRLVPYYANRGFTASFLKKDTDTLFDLVIMTQRHPTEWQAKEASQIPTSHTYPMSRDCCKSKAMQTITPTVSSQGIGSATIFLKLRHFSMFEVTTVNDMAVVVVTKDIMFMLMCYMCQDTPDVASGRRELAYLFQSLTAKHLAVCPNLPIKLKLQVVAERDKPPPNLKWWAPTLAIILRPSFRQHVWMAVGHLIHLSAKKN
jgi:hypothetical protein